MTDEKKNIALIILSTTLLLSVLSLWQSLDEFVHLPGNNQGYEPEQPLAYSHRLHAGELGIDCKYCHFGVEKSRHAGIPPANVCMNCHRFVTATFGAVRAEDDEAKKENRKPRKLVSSELRKLYVVQGLGDDLLPSTELVPENLQWIRINRLPDFVYFDHRPHVSADVDCQVCHGEVQTMERVRQYTDFSMGWCVNCHREANATMQIGRPVSAPVDCSGCHY